MGSGLLVLVVVAAAGFVLARRFGWIHLVTTLLNPSTARFRRRDEGGVTIFEITPARASRIVLLIFLVGISCIWLAVLGGGAWLFMLGLVPFVMGLLLLPIGVRHRTPVRLTVSDATVSDGNRNWPVAELATLAIRRGSRRGTEEVGWTVTSVPGSGVVYGGKPTAAQLMKDLGRRMAERSYLLVLRRRGGSDEDVLSGGLTLECATALLADLNQRLQHSPLDR